MLRRLFLLLAIVLLGAVLYARSGRLHLHVPRATATTSSPGEDVMIDKRFDVLPGQQLRVAVADADVVVETGRMGDHEARVRIVLEGRDMRRARDYFEAQHFSVEQDGEAIVVTSRERQNGTHGFGDRDGGAQIRVVASIPETFDADVRSSDGDIRLGRLVGRASLQSSDGDIVTDDVEGPTLRIRTSDGDVRTRSLRITSPIEVVTSDGDVRVDDVSAPHLTLRTSDGDVRAGRLNGDTEVVSSDGDLVLDTVTGNSVRVRTSDGDVQIASLAATDSDVGSSDGDIDLGAVEGGLRAVTSSGSIRVHLLKPAATSLRTSDGDIIISTPSNFPADVRLRAHHVRMASTLDFDGSVDDEKASGRINGGGPLLDAHSSTGRVTLDRR